MRHKGTGFILTGLLLMAAALAFTGHNVADNKKAQRAAENVSQQLEEMISVSESVPLEQVENGAFEQTEYLPAAALLQKDIPAYCRYPEMEMPVIEIEGRDYIGMLYIPALDLELPVASKWSYDNLRVAPCRYSGSAYLDNMVICAHNYRSFFSGLRNASMGTEVYFVDVDGNCFCYEVIELETLRPEDTEIMTSGDWDLTLFTCTVGGQSRIAVRCQGKETS